MSYGWSDNIHFIVQHKCTYCWVSQIVENNHIIILICNCRIIYLHFKLESLDRTLVGVFWSRDLKNRLIFFFLVCDGWIFRSLIHSLWFKDEPFCNPFHFDVKKTKSMILYWSGWVLQSLDKKLGDCLGEGKRAIENTYGLVSKITNFETNRNSWYFEKLKLLLL